MGALLSVKGPWPISADPAEAKRLVAEAWKRGGILATASALPNVIKIKPRLVLDEVSPKPKSGSGPGFEF